MKEYCNPLSCRKKNQHWPLPTTCWVSPRGRRLQPRATLLTLNTNRSFFFLACLMFKYRYRIILSLSIFIISEYQSSTAAVQSFMYPFAHSETLCETLRVVTFPHILLFFLNLITITDRLNRSFNAYPYTFQCVLKT